MSVPADIWARYLMAVEEVQQRSERITRALAAAGVPYALVGGQAVALWVATKDPAAVRITKDVDILLQRSDLPQARAAALVAGMEYCEVLGSGMFLERQNPHPRHGVHLVWAGEKVRPEHECPAPSVSESVLLAPGYQVVSLAGLVRMKLVANRDQDRVHLRDMIDVGLVGRELVAQLPPGPAERLDILLKESGR